MIDSIVYQAVTAASLNTQVIFENQNSIKPNGLYITINPISISKEINDWDVENQTTEQVTKMGYREIVYSINFYSNISSNNFMNLAQITQTNLTKQSIRQIFQPNSAIIDIGPISNLAYLNVDSFKGRASFDLTCSTYLDQTFTSEQPGYFDTIEPIEWTNKP